MVIIIVSKRRKMGVSGLEDHLGYWLRCVSNSVSHAFALKLAGRGVTVAEWVALRKLYDAEALAPSELAERLGMTRGAISKLADRLEAKGLLFRTPDDGDGRRHALSLTAQGRALTPELAALADQNDAEFFAAVDPDLRRAMEEVLRTVARRHGMRAPPVE